MTGHEINLPNQAQRIADLGTQLVEASPTWQDTLLRYTTPLGPEYFLELRARAYDGPQDIQGYREIWVNQNGSTEHGRVRALEVDLGNNDEAAKVKHLNYDFVMELIEHDSISNDVRFLLLDAIHLDPEYPDPESVADINMRYAEVAASGMINRRRGVWHTNVDGQKVYVMLNDKDGSEPWPSVDTEPQLQVRARTDNHILELARQRDGLYETYAVAPDTGRVMKSILGENRVLEIGGKTAYVDFGDIDEKVGAVENAERAMGLRDLQPDRLNYIEKALVQAAKERQ